VFFLQNINVNGSSMTKGNSMTKMIPVLAIVLFVGLIGLVQGQQEYAGNDIKFNSGQTVQPAFEGWSRNPDGSFALWFGYLNRNYEETPDVEIGPDNGFGGGGEDLGQPSHFLVRRQKTVFKVTVPADWPKDKDVVWTLKTHGTVLKAYGSLWPVWEIDSLDVGTRLGREYGDPDNAPPKITSPPTPDQTVAVGTPLTFALSVTDDGLPKPAGNRGGGGGGRGRGGRAGGAAAADAGGAGGSAATVDSDVPQIRGGLRVEWSQYRGTGKVKFAPSPAPVVDADGKPSLTGGTATTKVTFDKPGVYTLRAVAMDGQGSMSIRDIKVTVKNP
jgi:hypothetical protein